MQKSNIIMEKVENSVEESQEIDHERDNGIITFFVHPRAVGNVFILTKRFSEVEYIDEGSFGAVCRAYDNKLENFVAIKKVRLKEGDLKCCKRILREMILLTYFDHPNIVKLHHVQRIMNLRKFNSVYLVFELMEADLGSVLASGQEITNEHIVYFMYQVFVGVKYIHSCGVIHRDLKPQNILINEACDVKICDFGLSTCVQEDQFLTQFIASRWYRSPELVIGSKRYGKEIDMWSLGAILAEMILGRVLFPGKSAFDQFMCFVQVLGSPPNELGGTEIPVFLKEQIDKKEKEKNDGKPFSGLPFERLFRGGRCDGNPDAIDLVKKLLCYDPSKRLTIDEALKHPFFKEFHDPECEEEQPAPFTVRFRDVEKECLDVKKRIFKHSLFFNDPELIERRKDYFRKLKECSDGKIGFDQLFKRKEKIKTEQSKEEEEEEEDTKKKEEGNQYLLLDEILESKDDIFVEEKYQVFLIQYEDEDDENGEEEEGEDEDDDLESLDI